MAGIDFEVQNLTKICNETLILSILFRGKRHGYQLVLELEEASQGFFSFKHGTLYPILHKLEKEGLIKGSWSTDSPKRKRKCYHLTEKGLRALEQRASYWKSFTANLFKLLEVVNL